MTGFLAATPLLAILVGMGVLRRSAAMAGVAGLAVAVALAATVFAPALVAAPARLAVGTAAEALHITATILWIILPALAIHAFQTRSGATLLLRDRLAALTADRRLQAILIAWFFGLFMEGAAGFGTPVALAAPLLVGLGYTPVRAVTLALLGHAAGVSFGAVGTPALAQAALTGLDATGIAGRTAALHAVCAPVLLLLMVRLAGDGPLSRADLGWSACAALCFLVPSVALAAFAGPELPTLGGALFGVALFTLGLRRLRPGPAPSTAGLTGALAPYLLILGLVLLTRLVPPIQAALSGLSFDWRLFGPFSGGFAPLYHPGTLLFAGLLGGALTTRNATLLGPAISDALRQLAPVALALLIMLALSRLMLHAGMVDALAAAGTRTGAVWPFLAPTIGVLGTMITGSATASNILFSELQLSAAGTLGLSPTMMAAAQGFGAAIGNIIAPHNIIAGCATVGLVGREGDILARTVPVCLVLAGMGGVLVGLVAG